MGDRCARDRVLEKKPISLRKVNVVTRAECCARVQDLLVSVLVGRFEHRLIVKDCIVVVSTV